MPSISYAGKKLVDGIPAVLIFAMLFLTVYGCGHVDKKTEQIRVRQEARVKIERLRYKRDSIRIANGKEPLPSGVVTAGRWGKATPSGVVKADTASSHVPQVTSRGDIEHLDSTLWKNDSL